MKIKTDFPISSFELSRIIDSAISHNIEFSSISFNSKECTEGDLFISLETSLVKSELYIKEAQARGAYTLGTSDICDFRALDTQCALLELAKLHKAKLNKLKLTLAITGSLGKTTAKEFTAHILKQRFRVHSTHLNFNNALGVAITLLTAPADTECLVIELGMNHKGEISALSRCIEPNIAIITSISECHIGELGSRENIISAKLEILDGMKKAILAVPIEEKSLLPFGSHSFSLDDPKADFYLSSINGNLSLYFEGKIILEFRTDFAARHQLHAVLAALSLAYLTGLDANSIYLASISFDAVNLRQSFIKFKNFTVYDDSYSSSPDAVKANLLYISALAPIGRRSCILGDMLELGERTKAAHIEIGKYAAELAFSPIYTFGKYSDYIKKGALSAGIKDIKIYINTDTEKPELTASSVYENSNDAELILIKASRALRAERIIDCLKEYDR